jgi:hypothetical protein
MERPEFTGLLRPNIDYQLAYDLCARHASQASGAVAIFASSPFHAHELGTRLPNAHVIAAPGREDDDGHRPYAKVHDVGCIIWAEPTFTQIAHIAEAAAEALPPGGLLCALVAGRLARRLTEWREQRVPFHDGGGTPLGWRKTEQLIFQPDLYTIRQRVAFRGVNALAWDYAGQFAARFGRDDLADRCTAAMRAAFVAPEWARSISTIGVMVAERTGVQRL